MLPQGGRDHVRSEFASQAIATERKLAYGRVATLASVPPKTDRYGRLRAQIFVSGNNEHSWLQVSLLERGLARVDITSDHRECAKDLYAAEERARMHRVGIWASSAYAVRGPAVLHDDIGTYQIVEGVVVSAEVSGGRGYLDFGPNWRTDFTATISPHDMRLFRKAKIDPRTFVGKRVRVRGWIERRNGPEIEVSAPEQIEMVP